MAISQPPQIPAQISAPFQHLSKSGSSFSSFLNGAIGKLGNVATSALTGGLSGVVSSAVSKLFGSDPSKATQKQIQMQYDYNKKLYDYQMSSQLDYQKMFNQMSLDYQRSLPSQQVQGYKDAGLNPAALGAGAFSNPVSASQAAPGSLSQPDIMGSILGTNSLLQSAAQFGSQYALDSAVSRADISLKQAQVDKSIAEANKTALESIEQSIINDFANQEHETELHFKHGVIRNNEKLGDLYDWQQKEMAANIALIEQKTANLGQELINLKQVNKYDLARTIGQNIDNMLKEPLARAEIEKAFSQIGLNNAQARDLMDSLPFKISNMVSHGDSLDIGNFKLKLENDMLKYDLRERYWESGAKANPFYQGVSAAMSLFPKFIYMHK